MQPEAATTAQRSAAITKYFFKENHPPNELTIYLSVELIKLLECI
jgi:hypothetical protein